MYNLDSIKNKIVKNGFKELYKLNISIDYKEMDDAFFEFDKIKRKNYHIDVDKTLKKAPFDVLKGGMVHEIAHIAREYNRFWLPYSLDLFLYNNFPKYQTWDERKTDLLVVNQGYGPQLISFMKYANKRYKKYTKDDGLTIKEIKQILTNKK